MSLRCRPDPGEIFPGASCDPIQKRWRNARSENKLQIRKEGRTPSITISSQTPHDRDGCPRRIQNYDRWGGTKRIGLIMSVITRRPCCTKQAAQQRVWLADCKCRNHYPSEQANAVWWRQRCRKAIMAQSLNSTSTLTSRQTKESLGD